MRMLSCSSDCLPRWNPPSPISETFSPVCPSVRYGKESAPCDSCLPKEVTTVAAAAVLRKSLRSITSLRGLDAKLDQAVRCDDRLSDQRFRHTLRRNALQV